MKICRHRPAFRSSPSYVALVGRSGAAARARYPPTLAGRAASGRHALPTYPRTAPPAPEPRPTYRPTHLPARWDITRDARARSAVGVLVFGGPDACSGDHYKKSRRLALSERCAGTPCGAKTRGQRLHGHSSSCAARWCARRCGGRAAPRRANGTYLPTLAAWRPSRRASYLP